MEDILNIILQTTYSLTQFKNRLRLLKSHLLQTFFGGESLDEPWLKSLPQNFYQKFSKDNVYEILAALEKAGSSLPVLIMYLAFEPDENTLGQLGMLARQTFNLPTLLLDIKLSPNLIAGAALSWKGIYKDYSIRARIEEKRAELTREFRKFLR